MGATDPAWVFVDARYVREPGGCRAECPILGVSVTAATREEAHELLGRAVGRHLRPRLLAGDLAGFLGQAGFYQASGGEWIPRVTGEDERLYVRVTPIEALPVVAAPEPAGDEE
jgi:hypothetical protein